MKARKPSKPSSSLMVPKGEPHEIAPSRGDVTLADLLAPLTVSRFVEDHMDRRPLYLPASKAKRRLAAKLFDRGRLHDAVKRGSELRREGDEEGFSLRAIFPPTHQGPVEIPIAPYQMDTLLSAGASVCAHDIHRGDDALAALVGAAKHATNFTGRVGMSCYVSPSGHGLTTHFDAQGVLTLQIEGTKRWRFSEARAVAVPRANAVLEASGKVEWSAAPAGDIPFPEVTPPADGMREVDLSPGDLLYLPAGHWHETLAGEPSIGLVLYFTPMSFSAFLERWLWSCFEGNDAWFRGLPASTFARGQALGALPAPVLAYVRERLAELQEMLKAADPAALGLTRVWRRFIAQGDGPVHPTRAVIRARREDTLRVANPAMLTVLDGRREGEGAGFYLCQGDREIELPAAFEPLVRAILDCRPFRADSVSPLPWRAAREAIEALLAEGVLELCEPQ